MNAVTHVRALADGLMTLPGILDGPLVLGGHSAGAAVVVAMADHLADRGVRVRGLVLIDGVDNRAHMAYRVLRSTTLLQMTPVMLIDGEPSRCNQYGDLTRTLLAEGPGVMGWRVHGAGHGDVERWIPGAPGVPEARDADRRARPRLAYRIACGDASSNAVAERVQVLSATSIAFLAGQGCGMGVSGQSTMWPAAQQRAAAIVGMAGVHGIAPGTVTTLLPGSIRED